MEIILKNETIRSFLENFQFADQTLILQDLIVIGIQTVLSGLKSGPEKHLDDSLEEKCFSRNSIISQMDSIKHNVITSKTQKQGIQMAVNSTSVPKVKIVSHNQSNNQRSSRLSPRQKPITAKVTEIYPEGKTLNPARSQQKFRHHLDDAEIKAAFAYYEPSTESLSRLPPKRPSQRVQPEKDRYVPEIQNVSRYSNYNSKREVQSPLRQKHEHRKEVETRLSKQKPNNKKQALKSNNEKILSKNQIVKTQKSIKNVQSKIKDLIQFDKRNARNIHFHQESQKQQNKKSVTIQDNFASFKKIKEPLHLSKQKKLSQSSFSNSEQQFSPYKKQQNNLKYELKNYDQITSQLSESFQKDVYQQEDSQFSIYENNTDGHKYQGHESDSYSSYSGLQSSNSSRFPSKPVGKISKKR